MFYTIEELVQQADRDYQGNIAELMMPQKQSYLDVTVLKS